LTRSPSAGAPAAPRLLSSWTLPETANPSLHREDAQMSCACTLRVFVEVTEIKQGKGSSHHMETFRTRERPRSHAPVSTILGFFIQIDSHTSRTPLSRTNFGCGHASRRGLSNPLRHVTYIECVPPDRYTVRKCYGCDRRKIYMICLFTANCSTEGANQKSLLWDVFKEFPISQSVLHRFT
jgi:hypothetical protein